MTGMFVNCKKLKELDLSGFNTAHTQTMTDMFSGCTSLTKLNLSSFDTEKVTNMGLMFSGCSNLISIIVGSKWKTTNASSSNYMFNGCTALVGEDGTTVGATVDRTYAHTNAGGYLTKAQVSVTGNKIHDNYGNFFLI